jgi:ABC-2 type transport system ATP-binding protein
VSKHWNGNDAPVLDSVDLSLEPGTMACLVGANGAGKTTLLRILSGLIWPDAGTVAVDGLTVAADRREYQRRIGFLTAGQSGLYARYSVRHHLEYWASVAFVPRADRRMRVEAALRQFRLEPLAGRRADRMSTGQRQRLRLALTFLHAPSLVLLDEPQSSLDPEGLTVLAETVTQFVEVGGTAIWCAPTRGEVLVPVDVALALEYGAVTRT